MSLWKRFKEELGKTYDQVNTLDGGKSYHTRTSSGPVGYDRIRDTFDANTQWDYAKRNQRAAEGVQGYQPNMSYDQEQKQIYGVKRPYRNPGQAFLGNTARFMNSLAAAAVVTPETLRGTVASVTGNNDALNASLKRQKFLNEAAFDPNGGLFGAGTIYDDSKDFETATPAETLKKVVLDTAGTALEILPFTKGAGLIANNAYKGMSKGGQIAARTVAGALENTGQDLIEQSFVNTKWNPAQTLMSGGIGVVAPNAGDLAKGGAKVVQKGTQKAQQEVASVGGVKNFLDPTKDNEFMQYRTNYDTYAKAWDKETNPVLRKQIEVGLKQESENMQRRAAELQKNTGTSLGSGPMAGFDAINNKKAANATNSIKGTTSQIGDLMPDLKARQGSVIDAQVEQIRSKVPDAKAEDIKRNIERYGFDATNTEYTSRIDAPRFNPDTGKGITNIDAVVSGELKTKYADRLKVVERTQKPTVKVMSPEEEASLFNSAPVKVTQPDARPTVKVAKDMSVDPLEALKAEARKYKSADEFIATQGKPVYHGTPNKDFTNFDSKLGSSYSGTKSAAIGHWFTNNKNVADLFTHDSIYVNNAKTKNGRVIEAYPSLKKPKVYEPVKDLTTYSNEIDNIKAQIEGLKTEAATTSDWKAKQAILKQQYQLEENSLPKAERLLGLLKRDKNDPYQVFESEVSKYGSPQEYVKAMKEQGYDGVVIKGTGYDANGGVNDQIAVFDSKNIKTKQQLTDLYHQSKSAPVEKTSPTVKVTNEPTQPTIKVVDGQRVDTATGEILDNPTVKVTEPAQPKVRVVNGQNIDTITGEILETPRPPAKNIDDFLKNLPDSSNINMTQADQIILEGTDWLSKGAKSIDEYLKTQGDTYENFSRAIHKANMEGVEPPAKYKELYDQFIKPTLDKFRDVSNKQDIGNVKDYYLPRLSKDGEVVFDTDSLVDSVDKKVFGSSISRRTDEFQLGIDDIDHSPEALGRYATQTLSERYRNVKAINKVIEEGRTRGVEIPEPQAKTIVQMEAELADKVKQAADKGGIISSGMDKLNLVDDISNIGKAKNKDQFVLDKGLSWGKRQITDSEELYDIPYGGSGKTVKEVSGFERFTRSEGQATRLEKEVIDNNLDIEQHFTERYADVPIDEAVKAKVVTKLSKRIKFINEKLAGLEFDDGTPKFTPEKLAVMREHAYLTAEKNIARQQMIEFLENTDIKSKQLKKNLNQDAKRMLVMDAANRSLAEKTVGGLVGIKYLGLLGYSVRSALFNITEAKRVFAKYGTKEFVEAVYRSIKDPDIARRMGVHETKVSDILDTTNKQANPKWYKPMYLFQKSEQWKDNVLLHAANIHYNKKGLMNEELFNAVFDDFNRYGIKYGQIGSLGFNKSKIGRVAGQFLQYPIKDWTIRINETIKAFGGKGVTEAEKREAQKYLARDIPTTTALYLMLNAAIGTTWQEVFGANNPIQHTLTEKDAPADVKAVSYAPGGPFIQDLKDLYIATRMAFINQEEGEALGLGDVYKNELIKDAVTYIPGGQQIFNRTGGFLADQMRGYDENSKGKARYMAADDPINFAKGVIFGGYTTDNAREYYGNTGIASDILGKPQLSPVNQRYQDEINKVTGDKSTFDNIKDIINNVDKTGQNEQVASLIDSSREKQSRDKKFYVTPEGQAWKELNSTVYNPETKKYESDVISPEKWKAVQADKSSKTYEQLKAAANQRNRDFGDPIDPLFTDKWSKYKTEIMTMRSQFTGDDKEMKDIANATKPWYKDYMNDYIKYIDQMKNSKFTESEDFGVSPRVKQYWELTKQNPSIPENTAKDYPLISKYYDIKNSDPDAAKQFFKDNADALSAAFDAQTKAKFEWTNAMRTLEGADKLDWDTFKNISFGFEADELAAFKELGYKLGQFGSKGSKGSGYASSVDVQEANFGRAKAAPQQSIRVKVSKVKATPKSVKKITIKRSGKSI